MKKIILFLFTSIIILVQFCSAREESVPIGLPTQADSAKWFLYSDDLSTILDSTAGAARSSVTNYDTTVTVNDDSAYVARLVIWYPGGATNYYSVKIPILTTPTSIVGNLLNVTPTDTTTGSLYAQLLRDLTLASDTSLWANIPEFLDSMNARGVSLFADAWWHELAIRADSGNAGSTTVTDADMAAIIDTLFNRLVTDTVTNTYLSQLLRDAAASGTTDTTAIKAMISNNPTLVMANLSAVALQATLLQVQDSINKVLDSVYISTAAQIYAYFISGSNEDAFKTAIADIWNNTTRTITTADWTTDSDLSPLGTIVRQQELLDSVNVVLDSVFAVLDSTQKYIDATISSRSTFNPASDAVNQVSTVVNPVSILTNDMMVLAGIVADSVSADSIIYRTDISSLFLKIDSLSWDIGVGVGAFSWSYKDGIEDSLFYGKGTPEGAPGTADTLNIKVYNWIGGGAVKTKVVPYSDR